MFGTCAVLYPFFLFRMLGAGDIKLMAVCMGVLGFDSGIRMILCGFLTVLLRGLWRFLRTGKFWGQSVRLAGHLLAGYFVYLTGLYVS